MRGLDHIPLPALVVKLGDDEGVRSRNALADRLLDDDPDFVNRLLVQLALGTGAPGALDVTVLHDGPDGRLLLVVKCDALPEVERAFAASFDLPIHIGRVGCMTLLGKEKTEIATRLDITDATVNHYVHRLLRATGHATRLELAARQAHWGIRLRVGSRGEE